MTMSPSYIISLFTTCIFFCRFLITWMKRLHALWGQIWISAYPWNPPLAWKINLLKIHLNLCIALWNSKNRTKSEVKIWQVKQAQNRREMSHCLTILGKPKHFLTIHPKFFTSMSLKPLASYPFKRNSTIKSSRLPWQSVFFYIVPQMLVSVSGGCREILCRQSERKEKTITVCSGI